MRNAKNFLNITGGKSQQRSYCVAIFIVIMTMVSSTLFARGNITDIKFIGLRRTKPDYLLSRDDIKCYLGTPIEYFNKDTLITTLHEIGLFTEDDIDVEVRRIPKEALIPYDDEYDESDYDDELTDSDADATLIITVKEKWSIIPVPFIAGNNDGILGGAAFMDMNAFGRQQQFIAAGVFGEKMQMGVAMFRQSARSPTKPGFMVNARFFNNINRYATFEDDTIYKVDTIKVGAGAALLGVTPGKVNYSVGLGYRYVRYWRDIDDTHTLDVNLSIGRTWTRWNGWFLLSSGLSARGSLASDFSSALLGSVSGAANFQFSPGYDRMTIDLSVAGAMEFNRPINDLLGKASVGSSLISNKFTSDRMANAKITWETGVVRVKFMTLSIFASYEFLMTANVKLDRTTSDPIDIATRNKFLWTSGPGVGIKLYLKQLAVPCLSAGFYYNVNQMQPRFGFSIGMSM